MLDRRLTVNASIYYEDWRHVQLEAFPNDWVLNINGNYAHIYGADIDMRAAVGVDRGLAIDDHDLWNVENLGWRAMQVAVHTVLGGIRHRIGEFEVAHDGGDALPVGSGTVGWVKATPTT